MLPDRTPYEQAALEYCAPRGIRLSEFLEVWSDGDQWAALDWQAEQARRCSGCGQSLDETLRPGDFDKWNAKKSGSCDACRALEREARILANNDDPIPETTGARFRIWRDKEDDGGQHQPSATVGETRAAS